MNNNINLSETVLLDCDTLCTYAATKPIGMVTKWHPAEIGNRWYRPVAEWIEQSKANGVRIPYTILPYILGHLLIIYSQRAIHYLPSMMSSLAYGLRR